MQNLALRVLVSPSPGVLFRTCVKLKSESVGSSPSISKNMIKIRNKLVGHGVTMVCGAIQRKWAVEPAGGHIGICCLVNWGASRVDAPLYNARIPSVEAVFERQPIGSL